MIAILTSAIGLMPVFLFGCTGEIITEKSGHLNLGIPGIVCAGGAGGSLGVYLYVNSLNGGAPSYILLILMAIIGAVLFAALLGGIYAFLTVSLRCNQNISGLALTTFGTGLSDFVMKSFVDHNVTAGVSLMFNKGLPFASDLGWFGQIFLSHGFVAYFSIAVAIVSAIIIKRTKLGLRLRAVGENPAAADAVGIRVNRYKYLAILIGSGIAGLGGMFFNMSVSGGYYDSYYAIEALGWLAVALVIFTLWRPNIAIFGSILFAALYVLPDKLNIAVELNHVKELIKIVPYIVTVLVLLVISITGSKQAQPPANLGLNYFREER